MFVDDSIWRNGEFPLIEFRGHFVKTSKSLSSELRTIKFHEICVVLSQRTEQVFGVTQSMPENPIASLSKFQPIDTDHVKDSPSPHQMMSCITDPLYSMYRILEGPLQNLPLDTHILRSPYHILLNKFPSRANMPFRQES